MKSCIGLYLLYFVLYTVRTWTLACQTDDQVWQISVCRSLCQHGSPAEKYVCRYHFITFLRHRCYLTFNV